MDLPAAMSAPPRIGGAAKPSRNRSWPGWLLALGGGMLLVVVWRFEPQGQFFFPRCWLYQTTGLQCPGCGATRSLHALLNGDLRAAWSLNPFAVSLMPAGVWLGLRALRGRLTGRWWPNPFTHRYAVGAIVGVAVGFGIARNVPGWMW